MSYKHDTCLDNAPGRKGLGISRTGTTFNQSQARRRRKLKKKRRKKNAHTRHNKSKQDANILKSPVSKQLSSVRPSFSLSRSLSPPSLSRSHSPLPLSLLPPFPLSPSLSLLFICFVANNTRNQAGSAVHHSPSTRQALPYTRARPMLYDTHRRLQQHPRSSWVGSPPPSVGEATPIFQYRFRQLWQRERLGRIPKNRTIKILSLAVHQKQIPRRRITVLVPL